MNDSLSIAINDSNMFSAFVMFYWSINLVPNIACLSCVAQQLEVV